MKPYKCTAEQLVQFGPELCAKIEQSWVKRHKRQRMRFFKAYLPEIILAGLGGILLVFGLVLMALAIALLVEA